MIAPDEILGVGSIAASSWLLWFGSSFGARFAGMVLVGFSSFSSGRSMAMFAMMLFQVQSARVVSEEERRDLEASYFLSRVVACSLQEQTERANDDLQRGKLREHPTLHS